MGIRAVIVAASAALFLSVPVSASGPLGVYGIIEKIVFEPDEARAERIQVWGAFAYVDGGASSTLGVSKAERGYLYFRLPNPNPATTGLMDLVRREWADLKAVAGTGQAVTGQPSSAGQNEFGARREVNLIFTRGIAQPDGIPAADRTYLAQVVSARTGLPQAEAEKRVNDVITQAKAYLEAARKFAMQSALWLTLAMFLGAFAASLAAIEGGQLRDGRWRGVIWRGAYR